MAEKFSVTQWHACVRSPGNTPESSDDAILHCEVLLYFRPHVEDRTITTAIRK